MRDDKEDELSRFCDRWIEEQRGQVRDSSWVKYRSVLEKYIKPRLGEYIPADLDEERLEDFKRELLDEDGLSVSTVRTVLIVLRAVLKYTKRESAQTIGALEVTCPNAARQTFRILSIEEQGRLTAYLLTDISRCKFGILLALSTGLRVGELCALRWSSISLRERLLEVSATLQRLQQTDDFGRGRTRIVVGDPKSAASARKIPLTEQTVQLCRQMFPGDPEAYVLTGTRQHMEPRTLQYRLKKYTEACGLEGVHFNTLRDTFAARCAAVGFDPKSLGEVLRYAEGMLPLG